MSRLYGPVHRSLQDRFDTRRLADNVETRVVLTEIPQEHKAFIESRDMFFLSTIDHQGRPTVSYKGGDPGFVRVLGSKTLAFPCYDGNGMFYSMGNLLGNPQVGMLFVNFEKPHRLRVQGTASVDDNDPLLREYAEAQLVVRVAVSEIFRNCPRYVHRYEKVRTSAFVPRSTCETPLAPWKRVDDVQIFLSAKDRARVEREGGLISRDEYEKYMTDVGGRES
jgi:predicted pyridoxine 5'-phosphate oxidase superfamily flavin-nucleotide-binding protein